MFPNPFVTIESERYLSAAMRSTLPLADRSIASMVRGTTGGLLGPLFLLAPLGLLAARAREGRQLILAGSIFLLPAFTNSETRFLMPAAPFWALALAVALTPIREAVLALALAAAVLGSPAVVNRYCDPWAWRVNAFPLSEALRRIPEEVTLGRRNRAYDAVRMVEYLAPKNARLFSFGSPMQAYLARDVVVSFQSALGHRLSDSLWLPTNVGLPPTVRRKLPFAERPLRKLRVVQTGGPSDEQWSVSEIRIYDRGREVPRASNWKLRAGPNPWDVQLAFDNNPATRWRSAERIYPGMFIEIDLGQAHTIDSVALECADDQGTVHLKLEAETAPGVWSQLSAAATDSKFDSGWNLRKAAAQSLKAAGITHLLIDDGDFIAKDLRRNQRAWGIRLIGRKWTTYLYELQ